MEIAVTQDGSFVRFGINFKSGKGNIDERAAEELKRRFRELNIASVSEVIFDFKNVNHIGSAGIGKLLLFYKDLALNGGGVTIENTSEAVHEVFSVLKLDSIFNIIRT